MKCKQIMKILPRDVQAVLAVKKLQFDYLQEIRFRIGHPMIIYYRGKEYVLPIQILAEHIRETLDYVSRYSPHAYEDELKQGFITIEGGHRVGIAGQVQKIKQISSLNIRVSHEISGCADRLFPYIIHRNRLCHTMFISPPKCGKTTMLRDLIRQVSDGNEWVKGVTVGVVDERSELAGCYQGIPQNQMGMRTDVLDRCQKAEGMLMLIRSMSPQVIAVDEIGAPEEVHAIKYAMHCGCKMFVTVHGESIDEIRKKPLLEQLMKEHCFERYVVLGNHTRIGDILSIYDEHGEAICFDG